MAVDSDILDGFLPGTHNLLEHPFLHYLYTLSINDQCMAE